MKTLLTDLQHSIAQAPEHCHCHMTCEMVYVKRGRARFSIAGVDYTAGPGCLVLISPLEEHSVRALSEPYERYFATLSLPELTRVRNTASVPFGGRYRLIDFTLSNMVNSGVTRVGVVTHYNYQSLLDHLGTGKDWDLARRAGGLKLIPPNLTASGAGHLPTSRLESMLSALDYITHCTEDCLVLSDCDIICNIDLSEVIAAHAASGADITFVTKRVDASRMYLAEQVACITADSDGRVTEFAMRQPTEGVVDLYTNIMVVRRQYLLQVLADAAARGYTSFFHDVLIRNERDPGVHYRVYSYEGWYAYISSLENYYACSMKLLTQEARDGLFGVRNRPVLTKVRNSPPTRYLSLIHISEPTRPY